MTQCVTNLACISCKLFSADCETDEGDTLNRLAAQEP